MNGLTPEKRAEIRDCVSREPDLEAVYWHIGGVTLSALLDAADEREVLAESVRRVEQLAKGWEQRGEHLMRYSKTIRDEDISDRLLTNGAEFVEHARQVRAAINGTR